MAEEIPEILERLQEEVCMCLVSKKDWNGKNAQIHLCIKDRKMFDIIAKMADAKIDDSEEEHILGETMVVFNFSCDK